ncbi:hypothetical protein LCGC14_1603080 [marine sediment metagenome]|uniref:Uncharacterized protein n=1 Tax=marine sediment metagenome TaxID=412755 RepID=A0A0F9LAM5_9ZZZZ
MPKGKILHEFTTRGKNGKVLDKKTFFYNIKTKEFEDKNGKAIRRLNEWLQSTKKEK